MCLFVVRVCLWVFVRSSVVFIVCMTLLETWQQSPNPVLCRYVTQSRRKPLWHPAPSFLWPGTECTDTAGTACWSSLIPLELELINKKVSWALGYRLEIYLPQSQRSGLHALVLLLWSVWSSVRLCWQSTHTRTSISTGFWRSLYIYSRGLFALLCFIQIALTTWYWLLLKTLGNAGSECHCPRNSSYSLRH